MAHGPLTQNSLRAPGREAARRRKRPAARSPSDLAPRARPPCGPRQKPAHQPARAQRVPCSRPQPGPKPGKSLPAWAETRSDDREPSISIQRLREVSDRTKLRSTALAQTLASFFLSAPTHVPQSSRATPSADERERRERARGATLSPSPVCAPTVGWMRHCRVASVASLRVRSHRRGDECRLRQGSSPAQIHKRCAGEILGPTTRRRAMVGFYPRSP
jgi:hypothetical protein